MADAPPLGELTVGEKLGHGGYGEVHRATLLGLEIPFAVKFLSPSPFHTDLERVRGRFLREIGVLLSLRHDNITAIHGVGQHEGRPYILMDYFEGYNLHQVLDKFGVPPPDVVLGFIWRVSDALAYAHGKGILHRDVKPSNLMTNVNDARVLDFGIAHVLDPDGERFTRSGGTPVGGAFAAPELTQNPRGVDLRSDIYSLGACWFWLITGRPPSGLNFQSALKMVDGMTPDYERVVLKSLDEPENRFQSMQELREAVRALRSGDNPSAIPREEIGDDDALVLGLVVETSDSFDDPVSTWSLHRRWISRREKIALSLSIRKLQRGEMISIESASDSRGDEYNAVILTDKGEEWVLNNEQRVRRLVSAFDASQSALDRDATDEEDAPF